MILITDIHGDHMDPDSIQQITKAGTDILAPPAVVETVKTAKPIANGETKTWQEWTIEAIPAYNLKRGPAPGKLFHDKGRGNGYVLTYGGKRFYFSGDTEGVPEMRALKNIDVAFVCMNLPYTMPPDEAAEAVRHPILKLSFPTTTADPISRYFKRDYKAAALKSACSTGIQNNRRRLVAAAFETIHHQGHEPTRRAIRGLEKPLLGFSSLT